VPAESWWRSKAEVGGGCVIGSAIHRLDLLRYYVGEPEEVFAYHLDDPERLEAEAIVTACIRFRSGAIGELFCNWAVPHAFEAPASRFLAEGMTLFGDKGTIHVDKEQSVLVRNKAGSAEDATSPIELGDGPYESMWAHFARCIRTNEQPLTSGESARRSLGFVLAIYESMESGKPVQIAG
jgi:predicted dehydrogenase